MKARSYILAFVKFTVVFLFFYYLIYWILFNIKTKNGEPVVKSLQQEIYLHKDIIGRSFEDFDRDKKYDIIFLGSSHCYRTFDPNIFAEHGIDIYNFGSSSQTPLNSFSFLKRLFPHTKKIILEVYPVTCNLSGEECYLNLVSSIPQYKILGNMAYHLNSLRCYNILSLKPFIRNLNHDQPYDNWTFRKGYVETTDSSKGKAKYETYYLKEDKWRFQLQYIEKMIDKCQYHHVDISLVYVPVPKEFKIKGEEALLSELNKLCAEKNVTFYDFGRKHSLSSANHFFDDDHLNAAGVKLFDEMLIDAMK